jgi:transcriptional regulator with XRE-family HTH domain
VPEPRRSTGNPTVRRRELGALLRSLRTERGLTVEQVAAELLCSSSKVSRMETGDRGATQRDIRDLCDLYGLTGKAERDHLMTLAREGKQQGKQQAWWQSFDVPLPHRTYVGLEQGAASLRIFHSTVVPGLVQTADYARALHKNTVQELEESVIEERIEERSTRQQILNGDGSPRLEIIIDEAVLHRPIGGPAVMREQLSRLIKETERDSLTLQVIPYEVGAHPALESNFTMLEFAGQVPTVVFVEGLAGFYYLERQQDVERYQLVLGMLRKLALSPQGTARLVAKVRDAYVAE